jgi:hypothetical protein
MRKAALALAILGFALAGIPTGNAMQQAARERLEKAARGSRQLLAGSVPLEQRVLQMLTPTFPEDGSALARNQFPRLSDANAYAKLRPWALPSTRAGFGLNQLVAVAPDWPRIGDAGELRALLKDNDSEIRSLAIEALAVLRLPEDVDRINALVSDRSPGPPALAPVFTYSATGIPSTQREDDVFPFRVWSERTVGDYAWSAVRIMTGHRFDGKDPPGVTFDDWWKKNNTGRDSLWYWQGRLLSEYRSFPSEGQKPGETWDGYQARIDAYHAALHQETLKDLMSLSADAQAKIFLGTEMPGYPEVSPIGPVNELFPLGLRLTIGRDRILELMNGRNVWTEVQDVPERDMFVLGRLARLAPEILPMQDWLAVRRALEARAPARRWMPALYSRLLPAAGPGNTDDPATREGYLRAALANTAEGYAREQIAAEMVRSNLDVQWSALSAVFYSESRRDSSDARIGVLEALGEAPHTRNKLAALVELINDPRNETILTQVNRVAGMDGYRQQVRLSLNAIAGTEYISHNIFQDLGTPAKSAAALAELRRLAKSLLERPAGR